MLSKHVFMAMENGLNPSSNLGGGIHKIFKSYATDDTKNLSFKILSIGGGILFFNYLEILEILGN